MATEKPGSRDAVLERMTEQLADSERRLQAEREHITERESRVAELERDHRLAVDVKRERIELVERSRQIAGLIEQMPCACAGSRCPRCAALELLQS